MSDCLQSGSHSCVSFYVTLSPKGIKRCQPWSSLAGPVIHVYMHGDAPAGNNVRFCAPPCTSGRHTVPWQVPESMNRGIIVRMVSQTRCNGQAVHHELNRSAPTPNPLQSLVAGFKWCLHMLPSCLRTNGNAGSTAREPGREKHVHLDTTRPGSQQLVAAAAQTSGCRL